MVSATIIIALALLALAGVGIALSHEVRSFLLVTITTIPIVVSLIASSIALYIDLLRLFPEITLILVIIIAPLIIAIVLKLLKIK